MTDFDPLFAASEAKYSLPPGLLKAQAWVESRFNPQARSPKGAIGLMQFLPQTAATVGVDPTDAAQSIDGAGKLWQQNLKASGGDLDRAAMMYHGGPDTRQWGPKTQAYPGEITAALSKFGSSPQAAPPQDAGDPFDPGHIRSSSAAPVQPSGNDPFDPGAIRASASRAPLAPHAGAPGPSAQGANSGSGVPQDAGNGRTQPVQPGVGGGNPAGAVAGPSAGLQQNQGALGTAAGVASALTGGPMTPDAAGAINAGVDGALTGFSADLVHPLTAALNTVIPLDKLGGEDVKSVWDGSSLGDAFHHNLGIERANTDAYRQAHPDISLGSDIAGAIASPFNKFMMPVKGAGLLANGARLMAGGAAYGGTRGLSETGTPGGAEEGMALGAITAPLGAAVGKVAGKALGAAIRAKSTLANAIPQTVKQQVAAMIDSGASTDDIIKAIPEAKDIAHIPDWVAYRANKGKAPVAFGDAPPAAPSSADDPNAPIVISAPRNKQLAAALGTQGSRRGVEAITDVPPQVQSDVQRLTASGISPPEAQAEADIRYVGGQPTVANVTRSPAEQRAMFEGAKMNTPEGAQLADTIAANNDALHNTVVHTVDNLGGVPAQGDAAQTAAEALAKASDTEKAKVSSLYQQADEQAAQQKQTSDTDAAQRQATADAQAAKDAQASARQKLTDAQNAYKASKTDINADSDTALKDLQAARENLRKVTENPPKAASVPSRTSPGYIDITPLRQALETPEMANPSTDGLKTLVSGAKGYIDSVSKGTNRVSAREAEDLRSYLSSAYDPMGSGINHAIGSLKSTLDTAMDSVPDATEAYKAARAAHKVWAEKYDDPEGLSRLIARDAKGNFLNADQWRNAEGSLIGTRNDRQFLQAVRQLKAIGATDALNKLKAGIIQTAYERSTNSARDHLGNPVLNGKLFQTELNKIGLPKLKALFEPQELAHVATIGRAARALNEAVPGTVNTSGTSSSLINALNAQPRAKSKIAAKLLAHGLATAGSPILGNVAVELGGSGAEALSKRGAAKAVSQGIREQVNPALARALARRSASKIDNAQYRARVGRALQKPASTAAVAGERRNAL